MLELAGNDFLKIDDVMEKNFIGAMNFVAVNKTVENYKKSIERLNKQKQK